MIKSDTLKALAPALVAAQKKMGAALKDAKNPFFKSKFADLNAVIDAAIPVLNDHDIAVLQTPATNSQTGKPVIQTVLLHTSGEYIASETEITAAKANDPQASGSAISYARRYGLQATVTLKAVDDDAEAAMGRMERANVKESTGIVTYPKEDLVKAVPASKAVKFTRKAVIANTGDDI